MPGFVALDLGNVLCDLEREAFPSTIARLCGCSIDHVVAAFDEEAWHALESGSCDEATFRAAFLARIGASLDDDTFDACWNLVPIPRAGADRLVERITVPHAIWSNTDPIHARHLSSMRAIETARHRHFSFSAKARKPDAAYYRLGLEALGARPADVLFIDDRKDNRDAAAALGIVVAEAWSLRDVEEALSRHGLLRGA